MKKLYIKINGVIIKKYLEPVKSLLTQGITPEKLAFSITGALLIGLFPVLGSTTILCTVFALVFRLNLPIIQLVNFTVYPLQLLLLIPFMQMGDMIFGFEKLYLGLNDISKIIRDEGFNSIVILWNITMQAIGAWFIIVPVFGIVLYYLLKILLNKISSRFVLKKHV